MARDTPLAKQSAIPQAQLDNDNQANAATEALVSAATAQVEQARLNLGFTKVRSLIDGITGLAKAQIGYLVGANSLLTTISQVQPIKAYFAISEQQYLKFASRIRPVVERKKPPLGQKTQEQILSDGSIYPKRGVGLADRQVDVKTGTIRIASTLLNVAHEG